MNLSWLPHHRMHHRRSISRCSARRFGRHSSLLSASLYRSVCPIYSKPAFFEIISTASLMQCVYVPLYSLYSSPNADDALPWLYRMPCKCTPLCLCLFLFTCFNFFHFSFYISLLLFLFSLSFFLLPHELLMLAPLSHCSAA